MSNTTAPSNSAVWIPSSRHDLVVGPAPYTRPGVGQLVVRNHALAINPVDRYKQLGGNALYSWVKYPFVLGSDLAGEVVEVGDGVTRFSVGDRVIAHAVGVEKVSNSPAEGAFQEYSVVRARLTAVIPESLPYERAVVLPLAVSTAACGLFQKDQLGLEYPSLDPAPQNAWLLVWGGSTSVGSNAIQLAVAAGYHVITTASPRNFDYVRQLGASLVVDYASPTAVAEIIDAMRGKTMAGALAVATGSAGACLEVVTASEGSRFVSVATGGVSFDELDRDKGMGWQLPWFGLRLVASTMPLMVRAAMRRAQVKFIWGSSLLGNEVSTKLYGEYLPAALAAGRYLAAPEPHVVGHGLDVVQRAFDVQAAGVSARKVVVTL